MFLIDKNLRNGINLFAYGLFQVALADAFGVNINVAVVEVIAFIGQFLCQLFGANTLRATRTTKNNGKHTFSP